MSQSLRSFAFARITATTGALVCGLICAAPAFAQVTPAAGYTPSDDTPSISVGATIFADYTFQNTPDATDSNGHSYSPNAFNITRSYITFNGRISHLVSFRITPDIVRVSDAGSNLDGAYGFRLKYAFAQINTDEWLGGGSWLRLGQQQTPWVDYEEGVYRYRFQGPVMVERAGYLTSSDVGVSWHDNVGGNYGDVHVGVYNGEGYSKSETNNEKAFQVRGTVRPLAGGSQTARGLRISGFADLDRPAFGGSRDRALVQGLFEHPHLVIGAEYLSARDRLAAGTANVDGQGFSVWVNPIFQQKGNGWEALLRYDYVKPNADVSAVRKIAIAGISYWFPHTGGPQAALLIDFDQQTFPGTPKVQKIGVHGLINY